jgi:hypothetical protein
MEALNKPKQQEKYGENLASHKANKKKLVKLSNMTITMQN